MIFKGQDGNNKKYVGTACLVKKLEKKGKGIYAIITVAHNFRMLDLEYKSAKFILQRSDNEFLAMFNVKNYYTHEEYELNGISIREGYDIALAEAVIIQQDAHKKVDFNIIDE
jgi:hypothetical protein